MTVLVGGGAESNDILRLLESHPIDFFKNSILDFFLKRTAAMLVSCNKGSRTNPEGIEFHSYNISFFCYEQKYHKGYWLVTFVFSLLNASFIKYGYNYHYSFHLGS